MPNRDFSVGEESEDLTFTIDGEKFSAIPVSKLPGNVLIRYSENMERGRIFDANVQFFKDVLEGDGADRFLNRLDSKSNPINLKMMAEIVNYLVELYGDFDASPDAPAA